MALSSDTAICRQIPTSNVLVPSVEVLPGRYTTNLIADPVSASSWRTDDPAVLLHRAFPPRSRFGVSIPTEGLA